MSVVLKILTPTPSPPGECVPLRLWCGGRTHSLGEEGGRGSVVWNRDTSYSRSVIAFFSRCPVGEGTTEYTKLRFPEQGQCFR
jgi:hypothetical protein